VVVNKTLSLAGENAYSTTIDGSSGLVAISVTANDVQISGFRLIYCGIQIDSANRTIISNNLIDKAAVGISLYHSYNNTIVGNTISNCSLLRSSAALRAQYSNGSVIYHNNFLHDGRPPLNIIESFNKWDDGYPSGGNYWTTYMGVPINSPDLFKGPYQNETGSDGIIDYPYYDNWQGTPIIDNYPLTKPWPWGPHDIGITSVDKGTQKTIVWVGSKLNISVYVMNYGDNSETFNITAYVNTTLINETTNFALASRDSTVLNITWNISGFSKGNYTISAYAQPVPGEIDTADNNSTAGHIIVSGLGDLTGGTLNSWDFVPDGTVDGSDLIVVAQCFGSYPGAPPPYKWNANCDLNNDGVVDGSDLIIVARHFGESNP
jgi:parallel beta-helix repeat protein